MKKIYLFCFAVIGLVVVIFFFNRVSKPQESLIVGISNQNPPFIIYDKNNKIIGLDVDIIERIAKELKYPDIKFKQLGNNVALAVENKTVDLAISYLATNEYSNIAYSNPYFNNKFVLVKQFFDDKISSVNDLTNRYVGVYRDEVTDNVLRKLLNANVIQYPTLESAFLALEHGDISALVARKANAALNVKKNNSKFKIINEKELDDSNLSIATSKENKKLLERLNKVIDSFEDENNGIYNSILIKWFGGTL